MSRLTTEEEIVHYGAMVAKRTRKSLPTFANEAAVDVYDECRDHGYDILFRQGGEDLVDRLLIDVTDQAVGQVL